MESNYMKGKIVLLICIFLALLSTTVLAEPQGKGFYLSGNAGASWRIDDDEDDAGDSTEIEYDPGYLLGAAVGYDFGMLRTEAEFGYRKNSFDEFNTDFHTYHNRHNNHLAHTIFFNML